MQTNEIKEIHDFYPDQGTYLLLNLVLGMIEYVQYEYPPAYGQAVQESFPGLYAKASELGLRMRDGGPFSKFELTDDDICTLYTCYNLMGHLYVSDFYDVLMAGLGPGNPIQSVELKNKVNQHTLSNIRPFLQGVELYALRSGGLAWVGSIKARLANLPVLAKA